MLILLCRGDLCSHDASAPESSPRPKNGLAVIRAGD
jgi:hypothetical protein